MINPIYNKVRVISPNTKLPREMKRATAHLHSSPTNFFKVDVAVPRIERYTEFFQTTHIVADAPMIQEQDVVKIFEALKEDNGVSVGYDTVKSARINISALTAKYNLNLPSLIKENIDTVMKMDLITDELLIGIGAMEVEVPSNAGYLTKSHIRLNMSNLSLGNISYLLSFYKFISMEPKSNMADFWMIGLRTEH